MHAPSNRRGTIKPLAALDAALLADVQAGSVERNLPVSHMPTISEVLVGPVETEFKARV